MNENQIREKIKNNLIKFRQKRGYTQTELGILLNKKKTTVASWEQGRSLPSVETLFILSCIYNIPINKFFD